VLGVKASIRYIPALNTTWNLGNLFQAQKELAQARQMFQRALAGFQAVLGPSCAQSRRRESALATLEAPKGRPRTLVVGRIQRRIPR
jgi:hypothetical protein